GDRLRRDADERGGFLARVAVRPQEDGAPGTGRETAPRGSASVASGCRAHRRYPAPGRSIDPSSTAGARGKRGSPCGRAAFGSPGARVRRTEAEDPRRRAPRPDRDERTPAGRSEPEGRGETDAFAGRPVAPSWIVRPAAGFAAS